MSKNNSDTKVPIPDEEQQQQDQDLGQKSKSNENPAENNDREQPIPTMECEEASSTVVEDIVSNVLGILPTFINAPSPSPASTHIVPTHKPTVSTEKLEQTSSNSAYEVVVTIENTDTGDVPIVSVPSSHVGESSRSEETQPVIASENSVNNASNNNSSSNNCMALIPYPPTIITSKTSQMIPIALLRKSSNSTSAEEGSTTTGPGPGAGFMHLITGCNKVAPAELSNANTESTGLPTTTVGAVLMLIPKKSECVCVDGPSSSNGAGAADSENNRAVQQEGLQASADPNCKNVGSNHQQDTVAPPVPVPARPTQSYDSYEEVCRICHDNPSKMELISPCLCKGSMSKVHRACLERWLAESAKNSCEICNYEYNTVRKPKYKGCRSIYEWIRHPLSPSDMRNLFFDIACFFILTPLAAISSWLCVVGAQHYTFGEERRRRAKLHGEASALWDVHSGRDPRGGDASNATWTAVGLLSLTGTLLIAYSVWLFVAIKYHIQAWREWQQRNYTVTIVPFEDGCMGRPPPPRPPRNQSNNNNNNGSLLGSGGSDLNHSGYSFDANPNLLRYSGHNSVMRGRGRNSIFQRPPSRQQNRRDYNLPPIFSRNHFLRNPPPGYTISETTLLYQALYGSESDTFINDNLLTFFADSSDEITPSSSHLIGEYQYPGLMSQQPPPPPTTVTTGITTGSTPTTENPGCSRSVNNNKNENPTLEVFVSHKPVDESDSRTKQVVESNGASNNNHHVIIPMPPCADDDVEDNNLSPERIEDDQQTRIHN